MMQCNAIMSRVAGGSDNYAGYQLVVRDMPVRNIFLKKSRDFYCGILTQKLFCDSKLPFAIIFKIKSLVRGYKLNTYCG
jgi:hypothetical protein